MCGAVGVVKNTATLGFYSVDWIGRDKSLYNEHQVFFITTSCINMLNLLTIGNSFKIVSVFDMPCQFYWDKPSDYFLFLYTLDGVHV